MALGPCFSRLSVQHSIASQRQIQNFPHGGNCLTSAQFGLRQPDAPTSFESEDAVAVERLPVLAGRIFSDLRGMMHFTARSRCRRGGLVFTDLFGDKRKDDSGLPL